MTLRVTMHDYLAFPFTLELAREFTRRGHDVLFLHGGGVRPARGDADRSVAGGPLVESIQLHEELAMRAGAARLLQERRYARALAKRIAGTRSDVVLSVPSSLIGQRAAMRAAHRSGAAFVFWLQDIQSAAIGRLIGRRHELLGVVAGTPFEWLERSTLRASNHVVSITHGFVPILTRWGIDPSHVTVEPNWAPLNEVTPGRKANAWALEHDLADRFVFLYAGTLGRKHDPDMLAALADAVPEAAVVVAAEGTGMERLRATHDLPRNVTLLPLQAYRCVPDMLAAADVLVALLEPDADVFSVPSKVLTYLTAGRPILAAIPPANAAARTIVDASAGVVIDPGDRAAFAAAAADFANRPDARSRYGMAGRRYAEATFDIGRIAHRMETVLHAAIRDAHVRSRTSADTGRHT